MREEKSDIRIRHILVALDTSGHSHSALEAAATLARLEEAELQGIFVHDETWYRLSRLPNIQVVSEITGESRDLPREQMSKQIELLESRIREQIRRISRKFGIEHSCCSAKGSIGEELIRASEKTDLITLGRSGHSHKREYKLGKTARTVIRDSAKPVLLMQEGLKIDQRIIVVYDGTPEGQRALAFGLKMARKNGSELRIIALGNREKSAQDQSREIEKEVEKARIPVRLHLLKQSDLWNVTRIITSLQGGMLIIPKSQPLVKEEWVGQIFHMAKCPLLLMS